MRSSATRITYGALALRPGGSGIQTYIREVLNELPSRLPDAHLSAIVQMDSADELPADISAIGRPVSGGVVRALLGALPVGGCDVFHGLDVDIPVRTPATTVATIHDLSVIDMPEASSRLRAIGEQRLVRHALRKADVLLAVSEFTAERVAAISGREAIVVELAPAAWARPPHPRSIDKVRARYGLPERFVLQVGTVEPRKNVALVSEAATATGLLCVLAGAGSQGPDAPRSARGLGYVDVTDLPSLYAAATVTAYASSYEGFGLPPIEAMACGGAVVASAVGALPQVVGDGAVLISSARVDDWASAFLSIANDPEERKQLVSNGLAAASALTWSRTAERTALAYRAAGVPR